MSYEPSEASIAAAVFDIRKTYEPENVLHLSFAIIYHFLFARRACADTTRPAEDREPPLDNPYVIHAPREQILQTVREVFNTCAIEIDDTLSKPSEGKIVTKSVVFTRGVTARADLDHLARMPAGEVRNWQQGRWQSGGHRPPARRETLSAFHSAQIEGKVIEASGGAQWVQGQSNGLLEDETLRGWREESSASIQASRSAAGVPRRILGCEY